MAYGRPIGVAVHPGYATSYEDRSPQGAPGVYGYGYPTLAYGHYLGKREAEADASIVAPLVTPVGVAAHPGYATSFEHRSPQGAPGLYGYGYPALAYGHYLGKREAEADASVVAPIVAPVVAPIGVAAHPGYATSFEHRSPQGAPGVYGYGYPTLAYGHYLGKREAEADASVVAPIVAPIGVAAHPGYATSFEHRSPQGAPGVYGYGYPTLAYGHYLGKREAEADASIVAPVVAPIGVAAHPGYATSFEHRSPQGAPGLIPYAPYYRAYNYGYF